MNKNPDNSENPEPSAPDNPSFLRRHWLSSAIVGGLIAAILVSGGTAWAVSAVIVGSSTSATANIPAMNMGTQAKGMKTARIARGTITAMNGSSWTIRTAAGPTVSVSITSSTVYGTKKNPQTASDFGVGSHVLILGRHAVSGWTAVRVVAAKAGTGSSSTPAPTATP